MMLAKMPSAEIRLRKSGGGVFEITVEGKLAYSKKATGRFPTDEEVLGAVTRAAHGSCATMTRTPGWAFTINHRRKMTEEKSCHTQLLGGRCSSIRPGR